MTERGTLPRPEVIEQEIVFDQERHAVLAGLVDSQGRPFAANLLARGLTSRSKLFIGGKPPAGKSTVVSQFIDASEFNAQRLGIPFGFSVVPYEDILAKAEKTMGSRENWDAMQWKRRLNEEMFIPAINAAFNSAPPDTAYTVIIENPGVGKNLVRDVGKTTYHTLARAEGQKPADQKDSYFLYLIGDPSLQKRTAFVRGRIVDAHPRDVVRILNEELNVRVIDLPDNVATGRRIKSLFQNMAQGKHINRIDAETSMEAREWEAENPVQARYYSSLIKLPPDFGHGLDTFFADAGEMAAASIEIGTRNYRSKARLEAAHARFLMDREFGLGERGIVAFNTRIDSPIFMRFGI